MPKYRFTSKTTIDTRRFASFSKPYAGVKYRKKDCGYIQYLTINSYSINLQVEKTAEDIAKPDNNPNCPWKHIRFTHKAKSIKDAIAFLNFHQESLFDRYKIYFN